jgi:hypothetical protein
LTEILRRHAEDEYAAELATLAAPDDRPRPPGWRLQAANGLLQPVRGVRFGNSPHVGRYRSSLTRVTQGAWSACCPVSAGWVEGLPANVRRPPSVQQVGQCAAQFHEGNSGAGGEGLLASMHCR